MLNNDKQLHDEVEIALDTFIREFKETHSGRHPGASLLARVAIERTEEILSYRIMSNLFGDKAEDLNENSIHH